MKKRQKVRLGILFFTFLLFPAIFYYFSPYLIIDASVRGIINGSFVVFALLFTSSLILGRAFCGWLCPAGGCQEMMIPIRNRQIHKGNWIKWFLWVPWILAIGFATVKAGGYRQIDFFYQTSHGLSISNLYSWVTYFFVLLLIVLPAFLIGRRSFCHHLCWMAPFMIVGRTVRNVGRWPALKLTAKSDVCTHCRTCTAHCPMSLPVEEMVNSEKMEHHECILCGTCVDGCNAKAIRYSL
ncbi:MAG: 4Fe-4S binding protein [Calditrichaeota bacterium]|nr:MAG: 4Fe-4S binding protein [Calditrichota bacterium]